MRISLIAIVSIILASLMTAGTENTGLVVTAEGRSEQSILVLSDNFPASGVQPGRTVHGGANTAWTSSKSVVMAPTTYDADKNLLVLTGTTQMTNGDLAAQVVPLNDEGRQLSSNFWIFSIPVTSGRFCSTIVIPYHGTVEVNVGIPSTNHEFGLQPSYAYTRVFNWHNTLGSAEFGLLQSWMVNYNENSRIHALAETITGKSQNQVTCVTRISQWVSKNIRYNWPAFSHDEIPWQQATSTLSSRVGVCQDESAVAAALLRSLDIPCQTLTGTLCNDSGKETHQWDEALINSHWCVFDPTLDQIYYTTNIVAFPANVSTVHINETKTEIHNTYRETNSANW